MAQPDNELQLLLGLLALQAGLIDQDQLLAAFRDWSRERSMPLTAALLRKRALEPDQVALLEGLAAQHLKKHSGDAGRLAWHAWRSRWHGSRRRRANPMKHGCYSGWPPVASNG